MYNEDYEIINDDEKTYILKIDGKEISRNNIENINKIFEDNLKNIKKFLLYKNPILILVENNKTIIKNFTTNKELSIFEINEVY